MARPKRVQRAVKPAGARPDGSKPITMNLPEDLVEQLDAWAQWLTENGPVKWSRTDVVKAALRRALRDRGEGGEP
jgi:hypothetical protein